MNQREASEEDNEPEYGTLEERRELSFYFHPPYLDSQESSGSDESFETIRNSWAGVDARDCYGRHVGNEVIHSRHITPQYECDFVEQLDGQDIEDSGESYEEADSHDQRDNQSESSSEDQIDEQKANDQRFRSRELYSLGHRKLASLSLQDPNNKEPLDSLRLAQSDHKSASNRKIESLVSLKDNQSIEYESPQRSNESSHSSSLSERSINSKGSVSDDEGQIWSKKSWVTPENQRSESSVTSSIESSSRHKRKTQPTDSDEGEYLWSDSDASAVSCYSSSSLTNKDLRGIRIKEIEEELKRTREAKAKAQLVKSAIAQHSEEEPNDKIDLMDRSTGSKADSI